VQFVKTIRAQGNVRGAKADYNMAEFSFGIGAFHTLSDTLVDPMIETPDLECVWFPRRIAQLTFEALKLKCLLFEKGLADHKPILLSYRPTVSKFNKRHPYPAILCTSCFAQLDTSELMPLIFE